CVFPACSAPHGRVAGDGGASGGASGNGGKQDSATDQAHDFVDSAIGPGGEDAALDVASTGDSAMDTSSTTPTGCLEGATRLCKDDPELGALGNCGGGVEMCAAGHWGACSVVTAAKD